MNTQSKVNEIGVITYKNYTENVIIDNNFDTQALYDIMDNDPDFISFHILGTGFETTGTVTVKVEEEILSTTYNAYAAVPYKHTVKKWYKLSTGGSYDKKKDALERAKFENDKNFRIIERAKNNFKQNYYVKNT